MGFSDSNATNENDHSVVADIQNEAFDHELITVNTTATILSVNGTTNLTNRKELYIENKGNKTVWIGTSGVTSDTGGKEGIILDVGESITFNYGPNIVMYGIVKTGNTDVLVWESA